MKILTEPWESSQKTSIKGVTVLINVGAAAKLGGEEESEGGTRRWGGRKMLHGHKYLSPPIPGIACIAATAMRRWRRGSATVGEGAAPVLALETWG